MDKSKLIEGLKKIKEAFQTEQKFVEAKLIDGVTIIRYDAEKLDIGVPVLAVTEQGAIAMPDGDYELEDGTKFTIVGGVVSKVTPGEVEKEEDAKEEAPAPAAAMTEAKAKSIIESVIKESRFVTEDILTEKLNDFTKQKETFTSQKIEADKKVTDLEKEVASQKETIKQMFSLLEAIAGEPSAAPAEPIKSFNVSEFKKNYKADLQKLVTK